MDFNKKLERKFYTRDGITVAKELLGKILIRRIDDTFTASKIVESDEIFILYNEKHFHIVESKRINID